MKSSPTAKVLLVYLKMRWGQVDSTFRNDNVRIQCYPTLGLQYLSAMLKQHDVPCETWDQRFQDFSPSELIDHVRKNNITMIGFYTAFSLGEAIIDFVREARKQSDISMVVGGPGSYDCDRFLAAGVNAVCVGEGEHTIIELARATATENVGWQDIKGIAWQRDGQTVRNAPRSLVSNLDDLPFPDRTTFPARKYRDLCNPGMRLPFATVMASRGCPMRCSYCTAWRHWEEQVRFRSPGNVLAEIDELVGKYEVRYITMLDSVFGSEWDWLEEFCSLLAERKYPLRYKINFCPTTHGERQGEAFRLLRRSGCDTVVIGMQAADQDTLTAIHREMENGPALTSCLRHAKAEDILTIVHFMNGFPFEPGDEADKIIDLLVEAKPDIIDCYPLVFLPNTELREQLQTEQIHETYPYEERLKLASEVKKRFYSSPRVAWRLLRWTFRNNPGWFLRMAGNIPFGLSVIGFDLFKRRPDIEIPIQ